MINITGEIRNLSAKRLIIPTITFVLMILSLMIFPFFKVFNPEPISNIYNVRLSDKYVKVTAKTLHYSGYNLIKFGNKKYGYYYALNDNQCVFVILPVGSTPKKTLTNYSFKGKVIKPNSSYKEMLDAFSKDLNWDSQSLSKITGECVNNGEGSALLKNPELIREIVTKVSHAVKKPVTAKIRIGFEGYPVDPVEIAKIIEDSGAAAVAVHGRTRQQYYAGEADWDTIRRIKEAVSIPVIGNGDVDSPKKAEALVRETGCDGIMIGRAVRGNPWIFREMNHYFTTGELLPRPSWEEIREMILRHARMQIELKGEFTGIREMRKHIAWYTSGMRHSAGLRRDSNLVSSYEELEKLLDVTVQR